MGGSIPGEIPPPVCVFFFRRGKHDSAGKQTFDESRRAGGMLNPVRVKNLRHEPDGTLEITGRPEKSMVRSAMKN